MAYIAKTKIGSNTYPIGSCLYGTCSTAAGTAAKVVTMADFDTLMTGVAIQVKFDNANTASTPTLNVGGTGAKNIFYMGTQITTSGTKSLLAGVCTFVYDGTQWCLIGGQSDNSDILYVTFTFNNSTRKYETNVTYAEMQAALQAGKCVFGRYVNSDNIYYVSNWSVNGAIVFRNSYITNTYASTSVYNVTSSSITYGSNSLYQPQINSRTIYLNVIYEQSLNKYVLDSWEGDDINSYDFIQPNGYANQCYLRLLSGYKNSNTGEYNYGGAYQYDNSKVFYLDKIEYDENYAYELEGNTEYGGIILYFNSIDNGESVTIKIGESSYDWASADVTVTTGGGFSVQKVTVTIASNANYALINAPTVSGQRFVCWIGAATSGWLGSVFIPDMGSASTSVWKVSGSGNVDCFALYQKIL